MRSCSPLTIDLPNSGMGVAQDITLAAQDAGRMVARAGIDTLAFTT